MAKIKDFFLNHLAISYLAAVLAGSAFLGFYVEVVTYYHALADGFRVPFESLPYLGKTAAIAAAMTSLVLWGMALFARFTIWTTILRDEGLTTKEIAYKYIISFIGAFGLISLFISYSEEFRTAMVHISKEYGWSYLSSRYANKDAFPSVKDDLLPTLIFAIPIIFVPIVAIRIFKLNRTVIIASYVLLAYLLVLIRIGNVETNNNYLHFIGYGGNLPIVVHQEGDIKRFPMDLRLRTYNSLLGYKTTEEGNRLRVEVPLTQILHIEYLEVEPKADDTNPEESHPIPAPRAEPLQ